MKAECCIVENTFLCTPSGIGVLAILAFDAARHDASMSTKTFMMVSFLQISMYCPDCPLGVRAAAQEYYRRLVASRGLSRCRLLAGSVSRSGLLLSVVGLGVGIGVFVRCAGVAGCAVRVAEMPDT